MAAAAARVVMAGIVTVANVWAAGGDTRAVRAVSAASISPSKLSTAFNPSILYPFLDSSGPIYKGFMDGFVFEV